MIPQLIILAIIISLLSLFLNRIKSKQILRVAIIFAIPAITVVSIAIGLLITRIIYFILIGMEEPDGMGSPMAFIIGAIFQSIIAIPVIFILISIFRILKEHKEYKIERYIFITLLIIVNGYMVGTSTSIIYKENQKYYHKRFYKEDVLKEIQNRFDYKMKDIEYYLFNTDVEKYSTHIEDCTSMDSNFYSPFISEDIRQKRKFLDIFETIEINSKGGWSSSENQAIDINNYLFNNKSKISDDFSWSVLLLDKRDCILTAIWTKR